MLLKVGQKNKFNFNLHMSAKIIVHGCLKVKIDRNNGTKTMRHKYNN